MSNARWTFKFRLKPMRKLFIFLCLFFVSIGICQKERKTFREIMKERQKTQDTNSALHKYSKESNNKTYYNTSYGSSKYDKEINLDADVNPNNVEKSLENFREEKRREEIQFYTIIVLSVLGCVGLIYFVFKFIGRKKHSS